MKKFIDVIAYALIAGGFLGVIATTEVEAQADIDTKITLTQQADNPSNVINYQ